MAKTAPFAWLDGKLVPWEQATLHIATDCVLRGENVFEGERATHHPGLPIRRRRTERGAGRDEGELLREEHVLEDVTEGRQSIPAPERSHDGPHQVAHDEPRGGPRRRGETRHVRKAG